MRATYVVMIAVVAALLSACVSIPNDSPIERGRDVGVRDDPQLNSNVPPGPQPGASREEIVAGYFDAMLAYPRDDDLTRSFLTEGAAQDWDPGFSLVIYDEREISLDTDEVVVSARRLGVLDERGAWSAASTVEQVALDVRTERIDGQWRVTDPPVGTYIDADYFDRYYEPFSLYYFDPTGAILAPDPVYYLLGEQTATELVENLLRGPGPSLGGVVSTAVPDGLELTGSVQVRSNGLADIPLSDGAAQMPADQRRLLAAQLTWTLRPLAEVDSIALEVDGEALDVAGSGARVPVDEFSGYDPAVLGASRQLFGLGRQGLVSVSADALSRVPGVLGTGWPGARSAAVDLTASQAALVGSPGTEVAVGPLSAVEPTSSLWYRDGTDVLRPAWDVHGVLWIVDNTGDGAVVATATARGSRPVDVPGISGREVLGFAVSRDGTRLAAIVRDGEQSRLVISLVDRDADAPAQVSLSAADSIATPGLTFSSTGDVAWMSPISLAVLANDEGGDLQPLEIRIDGSDLSTFDGFLPVRPTSLAASAAADVPLMVGGGAPRVIYQRSLEAGWASYGPIGRVRAITYPG